jgi:histidinol-phosphatase (PHP family)
VTLPADGHVHSEWSWDAAHGSMERTCARAAELGLPSVAFTEHVDHTVWSAGIVADLPADHPVRVHSDADGQVHPPPFDPAGYLAAVERCRGRFPDLRILTGLELGEPHRHPRQVAAVLAAGRFDRVLGSLHCLPHGDGFQEPGSLYAHRDPGEVLRAYLLETARLVEASDAFAVLAHIDYPVRSWPGPFDPAPFEAEFRHALRATARTGRILEINTVLPPDPRILRWWHEEGGSAVTFGSDAHEPDELARGFAGAAALAEATGFRPAGGPLVPWCRG